MRRQGPFAWPLVAAALAAFVLAEMLFNLELVDAMASPSIDPGRVDDLTVFGKASGTFGFVLFAFRPLLARLWHKLRWWTPALFLVAWMAAYSGLTAFTPAFASRTARTGVDFLWIDTEHSPFGAESLEAVPVLVRNQGVAPMIRVAWNDPHLIKKAMDVGASAIMVPQVNTAEEAARAVQHTFYPPIGQRGISPQSVRRAATGQGAVAKPGGLVSA